ncbi:hypothetical protein ACWEFL_24100 [Streptomyces sp. NPDC004838]
MPQSPSTIGPDWPVQVASPGSPEWERTATRWLRDLLPARYAGYSTLTRHPAVLARHAQLQLQHEIRAVRTAFQTCRAELPRMGVSDQIVENTIRLYAVELEQLDRLARGVRLVTDALLHEARERRRRRTPV